MPDLDNKIMDRHGSSALHSLLIRSESGIFLLIIFDHSCMKRFTTPF